MFYTYFLKSLANGDIYIGSCENLTTRLRRHNSGRVKSTKGYRPWQLLGYEEYTTRGEAFKREKFYKQAEQRSLLKIKFHKLPGAVAKW